MSSSAYLHFVSLDAFINYLKNYCNIYEIGLVVKRKSVTDRAGVTFTTFFVRVTKHASSYNLILVFDLPFWSDILYNGVEKEIEQKRNEAIKNIKAILEKELGRVKIDDAEYSLERNP